MFKIHLRLIAYYSSLANLFERRRAVKLIKGLVSDLGLSSKDESSLISRLKSEGMRFLTSTLPILGKAIDLGLATGNFKCPSTFKRKCNSEIPHFLGSLLDRVFTRLGSVHVSIDGKVIKSLRQICFFFYKLQLPNRWQDERRVVQSFIDTEKCVIASSERLYEALLNGDDDGFPIKRILSRASDMISHLFSDVNWNRVTPKHSSGSVVGGLNQLQKYSSDFNSLKPLTGGLGKYLFPLNSTFTDLSRHPCRSHVDYFSTRHRKSDVSEVLLVPKDSRGPRLICREPFTYQFLQQGFKGYLMEEVETRPLMSGHVNFTDQTINQNMARLASENRDYSTLDLKDASDRNSLFLTSVLWSKCPEALKYLLASRTSFTLIDGKTIQLSKFAPMGSALCFPVMAINIFALIVATIVETTGIPEKIVRETVYVYGDDIIVKTASAPDSVKILEYVGFAINKDKSFINSFFTESCGADWYRGYNVTPMRLKATCLPTINNTVSNISLAQNLSKEGYYATAEVLYDYAECLLGRLPYGHSSASYLSRWTTQDRVSVSNWDLTAKTKGWFVKPVNSLWKEDGLSFLSRTLTKGYTPLKDFTKSFDVDGSQLVQGEYQAPRRVTLVKRMIPVI